MVSIRLTKLPEIFYKFRQGKLSQLSEVSSTVRKFSALFELGDRCMRSLFFPVSVLSRCVTDELDLHGEIFDPLPS